MKRILIISPSDSIRGPIIRAWLLYYCGKEAEISNAGFDPKPISSFAARVLSDAVIDLPSYQQKSLDQVADKTFDFVIYISDSTDAKEPELKGSPVIYYRVLPNLSTIGGDENEVLQKFSILRDEIEDLCFDFVHANIKQLIPDDFNSFGQI